MATREKIDKGISVKMHLDVYANARALEARLNCGRGINAVFRELMRRENEGVVAAILANERLRRLEEESAKNQQKLDEILLLLKGSSGGGAPPDLTIV